MPEDSKQLPADNPMAVAPLLIPVVARLDYLIDLIERMLMISPELPRPWDVADAPPES